MHKPSDSLYCNQRVSSGSFHTLPMRSYTVVRSSLAIIDIVQPSNRFMSDNGAREVILAYLSTHNIGAGQQASRHDIEVWCWNNQNRYGVTVGSGTYQQQIRKMIIGSKKWESQRHLDGLDDVFCSSSVGKSFVVVYDPTS
jgi:hypothetical protein